jgi:hypothetical protein
MNLRDLKQEDMDLTVWRYMPFSKFVSLLVYQALWFSKLNILQDQFEGMMPHATKEMMQAHDQELKKSFPPEYHSQFNEMATRNEQDSKELLIVNCWFLGNNESERMWREYGGSKQSVAIKSTVKQIFENIGVPHDQHATHIGRVAYVDHRNHTMTKYHANQGHERAFLKDAERYQHEQELRIVTLNTKTKYCVSPEGKPYGESEVQGKNMNNFENPGLYVAVQLKQLISEIRISPEADGWFYLLVRRIMELNNLGITVKQSELLNA